jgi:hypothetical protein
LLELERESSFKNEHHTLTIRLTDEQLRDEAMRPAMARWIALRWLDRRFATASRFPCGIVDAPQELVDEFWNRLPGF